MLVFEIEIDACKVVIVFALSHSAAPLLELVTVVRFLSSSILSWCAPSVLSWWASSILTWWASTGGWVWLLWSFSELARLSSKEGPTSSSVLARTSTFLLLSSSSHHLRIWLRCLLQAQMWRSRVSTVVVSASVVFLFAVGAPFAGLVLSLTSLS